MNKEKPNIPYIVHPLETEAIDSEMIYKSITTYRKWIRQFAMDRHNRG